MAAREIDELEAEVLEAGAVPARVLVAPPTRASAARRPPPQPEEQLPRPAGRPATASLITWRPTTSLLVLRA